MTGEAPETAAEGQVGSASEPLGRVLSLADFEPLAERLMDRAAFDYIAGGSGAEITLRDNIEAFPRRCLRPRVLVDVSEIDLSTDVLGTRVALPVGVAPMAFQHLAHTDAEAGMARAAAQAGALFCLSTMSSLPLENVASAADAAPSGVPGMHPRWFQLYVHRDRGVSADLVARAEVAGYSAIVLTVDLPVAGYRERDMRNQLAYPERFGNFEAGSLGGRPIVEVIAGFNERALTWSDVGWLRGLTRLPVVVKGVMTAEDAALAVTHGAAAVWLSNHGGRQLDAVHATIDVLSEILEVVAGRVEVYLDGGVRRSPDVVMALAMGARMVFVGRPFYFALGVGGEVGVRRAFDLLDAELRITMALLGAPSARALTPRMVDP